MFSEKNVCSKSWVWRHGFLMFLLLVGVVVGCSSRSTESDTLYASDQVTPQSTNAPAQDPSTQLKDPLKQSSVVVSGPLPTSPAEREWIVRYAESGDTGSADGIQVLKRVEQAEQRASSERTMEDYLLLATHYWFKGDRDKVVQFANQGVVMKSDHPRVKALTSIYLGYTYEDKSPVMAQSYFKQAVQIDPDLYKSHYELGRILFLGKKYSEAQAPLERTFELKPDSADIYGKLGQMFYGMDQYEQAAESFEKALALSPQTHWILLELGNTYFYGLKQREEGGHYYQLAVAKNDSDPEALYTLALFYRYKSNYKKAAELLEQAILLDHKNPRYRRELKDVNAEEQEIANGSQKYLRAIAKNPADPHPVIQLARFYQRWGKYEQAEKQFRKALQLASVVPKTPPPVNPDSKNPDPPAVQEPSKVPEYASHLGWFYFTDRKYPQAEKAFKTALKVDPKYADAQFGLGKTYEDMKQYDLAAAYYAETVTLDPKNNEAHERLAQLKNSGKLMPVGEVVKPGQKKKIKKSVMKVRK